MAGSQQKSPGDGNQNSTQNNPGPGYHYEYNYDYNFHAGPSHPPRKDNSWGDWIGIIVLLVLPFGITQVIGVIWAIRKVLGMSRQQRSHYYSQYRRTAGRIRDEVEDIFRGNRSSGFSGQSYDSNAQNANYNYTTGSQQAWAQPGPTADPQGRESAQPGASAKKSGSSKTYKAKAKRSARKQMDGDEKAGNGLIIGGAILSGIFGLGTVSLLIEFLDSLFRGYFFSEDLIAVLACGIFFAGGLAMLLAGIGGKNRRERILNYLGYIGLEEENVFRRLAKVIQTSSGDRKIPIVTSHGSAAWLDEEDALTESDEVFGQTSLSAYKLGTFLKVSDELLNDSVFDLPSYISTEFARRIGAKEEEAFFVGDGSGKPTGIFAATGGAQAGVTAASSTAITADELIDLFYSLKSPYRRKAVWVMNDSTVKAIRKLKDNQGQYLWQPSLTAGTPDTILNRPVYTSSYVPAIAAGAKTIAFGDFSYYWIADRQGRSFKRLNELFATTGQVGFMATQRVDGKLILSEAIKVLAQKASA